MKFSGVWSLNDFVEEVKVSLVGFNNNGLISSVKFFEIDDRNIYPADYQPGQPPQSNFLAHFDNISDNLPTNKVLLQVGYRLTGRLTYDDSELFAQSVRDTFYIASDSLRVVRLKKGDLNEDGIVNISDLLILGNNFGQRVD